MEIDKKKCHDQTFMSLAFLHSLIYRVNIISPFILTMVYFYYCYYSNIGSDMNVKGEISKIGIVKKGSKKINSMTQLSSYEFSSILT